MQNTGYPGIRWQPSFRKSIRCKWPCAMLTAFATLGFAAGPAVAATSSPPLGCEPIACAAAYIGVPEQGPFKPDTYRY